MSRLRQLVAVPVLVATLVLAQFTGVAWAGWSAGSSPGGHGAAAAGTVERGNAPAAVAHAADVDVSWAASTLADGAAVSGYLITRYDADTLAQHPTVTGCAGVVAATTCTENGVADGRWTYTVTPVVGSHWTGAESPLSGAITTDATHPTSTITTTVETGNAVQYGDTIFYRGVAAGSFTLTNTVVDTGSGPGSSTTSAPAGRATGWTHPPSTVTAPAGGPYVSAPFGWSAGTTSSPTEVVTGADAAGNVTTTTLSFVDDSAAPTGGSVSYPNGYQPDPSVTVTLTAGTDAGSGIATRRLQRAQAPLTNKACGTFTAFADLGPNNPTSPYVDTAVSDLRCYTYRYLLTDLVGNQQLATSTSVAKVDASAVGPALGTAGSFSVLAGTGVANTLATTVSGDLGVSPSDAVAGFPPGIVAGDIHAGDAAAAAAHSDLVQAYTEAAGRVADGQFAGDQNGRTFRAGTYHSAAAFALTGTMTLDAEGDANAVFVFQVGAALNTAAASHVVLANGAQASHVYWQVAGAAGTGANSTFVGTIMANGAITLGQGTELIGRALSYGTVTLADNTIQFTSAAPPTIAISGGAAPETKDTTPTLAGTTNAPTGSAVTVTVAGQVLSATVPAGGSWSVTAAALGAGVHPVRATVRDAAGNAGAATQDLTVEVNPAAVSLDTAGSYSVLAATGVVNTGQTVVAADLGVSPSNAVTGFPPGRVDGTTHAGDTAAARAQTDLRAAYQDAAGRTPSSEFSGDQKGRTFHEGVLHTTAAFALTGTLTLDAQGDADAVFIIQVGAALNTAASSRIVLANGALASHVFWQVAGAAGTGANSTFVGTIMADSGITLGAGTRLTGRALSGGTVTLADNAIAD